MCVPVRPVLSEQMSVLSSTRGHIRPLETLRLDLGPEEEAALDSLGPFDVVAGRGMSERH